MHLFKFALLLAFAAPLAQAQNQVRSVFKGAPTLMMGAGANLKQMTFGLSARQNARIKALTSGKIKFDDVFYVDHTPDRDLSGLSTFSGVIQPNVPPPVEQQIKAGDPELVSQWWIEKLGVHEAWPQATGQGVTIADCDAGFFHDEADLFSNMLLEHKFDLSNTNEPHVVDDGPFASHGTSVTAIMAGVMNGTGTNGIAYNSKIVPLQNFNYDHRDVLDKEEATAKCILRAITIPNVSIIVLENQTANGSSETFAGTRDAVRLALRSGIIIVSAGGNYNAELLEEKKDDTNSIIVGALTQQDTMPYWSNFGDRITVAAYGEKLHTLSGRNGAFEDFGGTSGATPQVAATVALMKEVAPLLTPDQAKQILIDTRRNTPETAKVGGILNVPAAVAGARGAVADVGEWSNQMFFREQLRSILLNP